MPTATTALACPLGYYTGPDPYWLGFFLALCLLLGTFIHWRRVRPVPRRLLRVYAGVGGAAAFLTAAATTYARLTDHEKEVRWLLVLKLCTFVAANLLAEIVLNPSRRGIYVPFAIRRRRR